MKLDATNELIQKIDLSGGKKILHFGSLAGWPYTMANVSRTMGIKAENWVHMYKDVDDLDRKLPYDASIFVDKDPLIKKMAKTLAFLKNCPNNFCLIHYHSTNLLHRELHFLFEGPFFKRKKIPMVLSLGGGDSRLDAFSKNLNKYYYKTPSFLHDLRIKMRWMSWRKNITLCATEPEIALIANHYFDNVKMFRQPVEIHKFPFNPPSIDNQTPLLLHVPTSPEVKGTKYILAAVENLKKKGLQFEFKMLRRLTQSEFYNHLAHCDVYIDELRLGGHGVTAVESMAMGKPTISYIREDLISHYPQDLPLVNANPDTIERTLERLVLEPKSRFDIGSASRRYAEKYHDAEIIINDMSSIYLEAINQSL